MEKPSKANTLNMVDIKAQAVSALIFLAPTVISLIAILTPQADALFPDPTQKMIALAVMKWVGDQLTGLVRRYKAGK